MNRYFNDARYYLTRTVKHVKYGVAHDVSRAKAAIRSRVGEEQDGDTDKHRSRLHVVRERIVSRITAIRRH